MDLLKLENQLCFPLYAASRQLTSIYRPLLEKIDLTYPQYLVMMLLWEHGTLPIKTIGESLLLDTGTLTPLLKRMEQKGLLSRKRNIADERSVSIEISTAGQELRNAAEHIPGSLICNIQMGEDEVTALKNQLNILIAKIQQHEHTISNHITQ